MGSSARTSTVPASVVARAGVRCVVMRATARMLACLTFDTAFAFFMQQMSLVFGFYSGSSTYPRHSRMATHADRPSQHVASVAALTTLGKRIELLRIERGRSKQQLAMDAGTSRQQLWRVMMGKSELTTRLRNRLAAALGIDVAHLVHGDAGAGGALAFVSSATIPPASSPAVALTVGEYISEAQYLATTLRSLPSGDGGRRLKRALLIAIEDLAVETGRALPADYSEMHRRVLAGEL